VLSFAIITIAPKDVLGLVDRNKFVMKIDLSIASVPWDVTLVLFKVVLETAAQKELLAFS